MTRFKWIFVALVVLWVVSTFIVALLIARPDVSSNGVVLPPQDPTPQIGTVVQIGRDTGKLDRSPAGKDDAVLIACKIDHGGRPVISKGYHTRTDRAFQVTDRHRGDGCEKKNTHRNLAYHWLSEGVLDSRVSYHIEASAMDASLGAQRHKAH